MKLRLPTFLALFLALSATCHATPYLYSETAWFVGDLNHGQYVFSTAITVSAIADPASDPLHTGTLHATSTTISFAYQLDQYGQPLIATFLGPVDVSSNGSVVELYAVGVGSILFTGGSFDIYNPGPPLTGSDSLSPRFPPGYEFFNTDKGVLFLDYQGRSLPSDPYLSTFSAVPLVEPVPEPYPFLFLTTGTLPLLASRIRRLFPTR